MKNRAYFYKDPLIVYALVDYEAILGTFLSHTSGKQNLYNHSHLICTNTNTTTSTCVVMSFWWISYLYSTPTQKIA